MTGAALAIAMRLFAGCADDETEAPPASCPDDLPASCPANVPSYADDIAPIIAGRCFPCHDSGGEAGPNHDFTSYQAVYDERVTVLGQVYGCRMPPAGSPEPTPDERALMLRWFVCHAPDN